MKTKHIFIIALFFLLGSYIKVDALSLVANNWSELSELIDINENAIITLSSEGVFTANSTINITNKNIQIIPEDEKIITITKTDSFKNAFFQINNSEVTFGSNSGSIKFRSNEDVNQLDSAINIISSKVFIKYVYFENNHNTNSSGGAIYTDTSEVNISDSYFTNNYGKYGGAIRSYKDEDIITINNSIFSNNKAVSGSGGAIYAQGNFIIDNSNFEGNIANTYGGALIVKTNTTITDSVIVNNIATNNNGGGVQVDGTLTLDNTIVQNNRAANSGGGINFYNGSFNNTNNTIINNYIGDNTVNNLYPDYDSENNIDWKQNDNLKIERISVDFLKKVNDSGTQGFTIAGDNIVIANWISDTDPVTLTILNASDLSLKNTIVVNPESSEFDYGFGHANDLTYDENTGYIYLYTYNKNEENKPIAAKFKINSSGQMTDLEYFIVPRAFSAIAYDKDNNHFIISSGGNIYIYDQNWNELKSFPTLEVTLTRQGITYYNGLIYYSTYEHGASGQYQDVYNTNEKKSNLIYIYDLDGNLVKTLYISKDDYAAEIEDVSFMSNGELMLSYNKNGTNLLKTSWPTLLKEISINTMPTKLEYDLGEGLDVTSLKLNLVSNSGNTTVVNAEDLSGVEFSGYDSKKTGIQTVTVKYQEKETTFSIEVLAPVGSPIPSDNDSRGASINNTSNTIAINPKTGIKSYLLVLISLITFTCVSLGILEKRNPFKNY